MNTCQKCGAPMRCDWDYWTIFCNDCLNAAREEVKERRERIAIGDTTVPDLTKEERQRVLQVRREQRAAVVE